MSVDDDAGAAVARRRLGRLLTQLRESGRDQHGGKITMDAAASYIERARPTLYRIEHGLPGVKIKDRDLRDLVALYGASPSDLETLLALAAVTRVRGWFHPFTDVLPPGFDIYVGLENAAAEIAVYEEVLVHGLVQTPEYARELLQIPSLDGHQWDADELERRVSVRMRRQEVITRADPRPVRFEWLLGETVLRRPLGGRRIMADQLRHIAQISELPNVKIRVIPLNVGLHQGLDTGPFAILRFPDESNEPPTIYVDGYLGNTMLNKPDVVDRFDGVLSAIRNCALDERASRELIHRAAKELSSA